MAQDNLPITAWANTQHAVGLVLDGSTRYVDK